MIRKTLMLLIAFASLQALGQQNTLSPYSFFGMGLPNFKGTVENRLMGGIEVYSDSIHANLQNPAGLGELKLINYNLGASYRRYDQQTEQSGQELTTTTFDYLALGIPMGKLVAAFGLVPQTSVGYRLQSSTDEDFLRNSGTGGTNRVFLAFAYNLTKDLNLGVEANYNFGHIRNNTVYYQTGSEYGTREQNDAELSGFGFNFGATYQRMLSEKLQLHSSFSYSPEVILQSKNERRVQAVQVFQSGLINVVENLDLDVENSEFTLPSEWTLGLGIGQPRKWFVGGEYSAREMSRYTRAIFSMDNVAYSNSASYRLGGHYTPDYRNVTRYFKRITYRAGMRFEESGLNINGEDINEFGISFGVSLPVGRLFSNINLGAEYGQRGTTKAGLVKESFVNVFVSLSLNDRWFEKRLYD